MPTFSNVDDLMKYVDKAVAKSIDKVGDRLVDEFKWAIDEEVYDVYSPKIYDRTYQLRDKMVEITEKTKDKVEVRVTHTGGHISYIKGTRFYVPYGLEGGFTWGRNATDIQGNIEERAEQDVPNVFKKAMKENGVNVK